jgi:hypothetical protein
MRLGVVFLQDKARRFQGSGFRLGGDTYLLKPHA